MDTCKNKEQQIPELCEIAVAEVMIGFSDLEVWFSIKDCSELLDYVKKIWDSTNQVNYKCKLDNFLHSYTLEITSVYNKYKCFLEKIRQLQLIENRTAKLITEPQPNFDGDLSDRKQFIFSIERIDEFNVIDFQQDNKKYIYCLEISYQTLMRKIKGQVEAVAQHLTFDQDIQIDLPLDMGTLQLNLFQEFENEQICIAQRNLDPFTSLGDETTPFPFRVGQKNKYLNLMMKIRSLDDIQQHLGKRLKYLKDQYEKLFKKCHKYKIKLTLLLKPFQIIKFDDENIYLQKVKSKKSNKGCLNCLIF